MIKVTELTICGEYIWHKLEAKDLRIGNKITSSYPLNEGILTVDAKLLALIDKLQDKQVFEPIPLTPEILEKCGFVKDYDGFHLLEAGRRMFRIDAEELSINYKADIGGQWFDLNANVEYLHQLQNLFYALTGTDLTIEL